MLWLVDCGIWIPSSCCHRLGMDILPITLVEILVRIRIMSIVLVAHEAHTEMCLLRLLLLLVRIVH